MDAHRPDFGGKYEVRRVLGRGGMGTVFEARHSRLGQRVAIKVLAAELGGHPSLVQRFEREGRAASALSSPHAVRIYDIDQTEDGRPFIVMELLGGRDLAHVVDRAGKQPIGEAVRWIVEACDAIGEAHRLGIIHRDVKPSNLHLCDDGSIKVLDFGIAKRLSSRDASITLGSEPLGTPQYMAPEQVRTPHAADARADIWSLGATLYELVCGRPPFNEDAAEACIAALVVDPVPDPRQFRADLPDGLAEALLKALAKNPNDRFQSVGELVTALAPFLDPDVTVTIPATPPTTLAVAPARASMPVGARRSRARTVAMLVGAAALGVVAFVALPRAHADRLAPRSADAVVTSTLVTTNAPILAAQQPAALTPPEPDVDSADAEPAGPPPPPAHKPARQAAAAPAFGVHGGLSNPGF